MVRDICLRYGVVPAIHPGVDLYNAIRLRYAVPVGDENGGFILESLPEMPQAALCEAGDELFAGLQRMMPGYCCEKTALGL